ncbi:MAG: DUF2357 domain-containing protein [Bacilli bacterium]|nr:hypothetical protein [Bacilli bacterium]MDD3121833.1 hypothetical protein [Bacilli bacterium]MDD4482268.1 hypothetical protein [Bacilli bacterium]
MAKSLDNLDIFYQNYINNLTDQEKDQFVQDFYKALDGGDNTLYQKNMSEVKTFDETWIDTVESYFPSLDKITRNPRTGLKYNDEIVPIEKAKKVSSQSIKHLSSHTYLIKEVNDDGTIMPKKILVSEADTEYGTYENRFLMTLIERLFIFVRNRFDVIKENILSFDKKHFNYKSKFNLNDSIIEMDFDLVVKDPLEDKKFNDYNRNLLGRVENLNKLISSLRSSKFMNLMKNQKTVTTPIMRTQIIQKNVDFNNAYLLWLFLDKYNLLTFDLVVKEKNLRIDRSYLLDIKKLALSSFATIIANQRKRKTLYDDIDFKEYKKKSFKTKSRDLNDVVDSPEGIEVEDTNINQYYFQESKKLFRKNLDDKIKNSSTFDVGLKRALRDTINISNTIFSSYFELEEDVDIFQKLIKNDDPEELIEEAKYKAKIAKIIRETKEVDYRNYIRLEKKLLKEIQTSDQKLINILSKKQESNIVASLRLEELKQEKMIASTNERLLSEKEAFINKAKEDLVNNKNSIYEKLKENLQKKKDLEKKRLELERNKIKEEYLIKKNQIITDSEEEKLKITQEFEQQLKAFEDEQKDIYILEEQRLREKFAEELKQLRMDQEKRELQMQDMLKKEKNETMKLIEKAFGSLKESIETKE